MYQAKVKAYDMIHAYNICSPIVTLILIVVDLYCALKHVIFSRCDILYGVAITVIVRTLKTDSYLQNRTAQVACDTT